MIQYTEEIQGILAVELYQASACRSIVEQAKDVDAWAEAEVIEHVEGEFNPATRPEARRASVLAPSVESEIRREFDLKMVSIVKPLVKEVWGVDLRQHSETHFVRYCPGNYYTPHSDTGLHRNDRYFTVVCYLNDDFEGGQTSFPQLYYRITPRCGKAVIFPATYLHCAEPVTSGEKYILVSWLTGPTPTRWI
ncbi:MAG TPA: 2OG-Fe(II) oxygenase [Pyrinomonadaceae bacterium]|nr:2OG-Fe(II) oxygenase [Pyrinomonadaceae bacterium]